MCNGNDEFRVTTGNRETYRLLCAELPDVFQPKSLWNNPRKTTALPPNYCAHRCKKKCLWVMRHGAAVKTCSLYLQGTQLTLNLPTTTIVAQPFLMFC
jgi:hypothetical protein